MTTLTWILFVVVTGLIARVATKIMQWIAAEKRHPRLLTYINNLPPEGKEALFSFVNQGKHTLIMNPSDKTAAQNTNMIVSTGAEAGHKTDKETDSIPIDLWLAMVEATPKGHKRAHTQDVHACQSPGAGVRKQ